MKTKKLLEQYPQELSMALIVIAVSITCLIFTYFPFERTFYSVLVVYLGVLTLIGSVTVQKLRTKREK